jgi:thiamine biosynthesis lipoprotein
MKQLRLTMGMPVTVEIAGSGVRRADIDIIFDYFARIDNRFSPYKKNSEVSLYNRGEITKTNLSSDMKLIMKLSDGTKKETGGYFNIFKPDGSMDPSGIVKGWAIQNASKQIEAMGYNNYSVDAGGDIQVKGHNAKGKHWTIGIRNPFNRHENVKIISIGNQGVATSGTYIRGQHIYDPFRPHETIADVVSITVIGPDVYEADRFATAAFAMRDKGVGFIAALKRFEAYSINSGGIATFTPGFEKYVVKNN